MNKYYTLPISLVLFISCSGDTKSEKESITNSPISSPTLTLDQANKLGALPFECIDAEFPNKLSQTLGSKEDLGTPEALHPSFYGCFDWHSSVHGHWSLTKLLNLFPNLAHRDSIVLKLNKNISQNNIRREVNYFQAKYNKSYERTYGWAWLLKLAEELHTWDTPLARQLELNLQPLTDLIVSKFEDYLPKLNYPIRVGTHSNTAFGLSLAWDYAVALGDETFQSAIRKHAKAFYIEDKNCPIDWEPSGTDFLSPCLEEAALMRRVLPEQEFKGWLLAFLPQLTDQSYAIVPGEVSDRTDGHLVHLDGYNFSRAWNLSIIARGLPQYGHLQHHAKQLINYSLPNIFDDDYMGSHWLGTFAIYALVSLDEEK